MNILVVDDSRSVRLTYKQALKNETDSLHFFQDGQELLDNFQAIPGPHIIVLDWLMPNLSGLETCKRIRETHHRLSTYIIMVSAKDKAGDIVECLDAGANDYLKKPVVLPELAARVRLGRECLVLFEELNLLRGLIPICAWCHKVRDENNLWKQVDTFFQRFPDLKFSHGICPSCRDKVLASENEKDKEALRKAG